MFSAAFSLSSVLRISQMSANECIWHMHLSLPGGVGSFVDLRIFFCIENFFNLSIVLYCIVLYNMAEQKSREAAC
jgi:hypothetical protein